MKALVLVGVFILLYHHPSIGKPLTGKTKSESTELIREKRGDLDEDDRSSEMQKFMLDLSSKEDMSRLKERFKSGATQDIENDTEYRRLKRFSIHDSDDEVERRDTTSAKETMHMKSSRVSKAVRETSASFEERPSVIAKTTLKRFNDGTQNFKDQLEHLDDNMKSLAGSLKRSEKTDDVVLKDKSKRTEDKSTTKNENGVDNLSDGNKYNQNLPDVLTRRDSADSETEGSRVNSHHIVGKSWELIHHYPTAYFPSSTDVNTTILNNTTMHSEYLGDNNVDGVAQYDADDVTQYERAGKSRRKPRVSHVRPVRSIETDYEVRELSEINNSMMPQNLHEDSGGHVVMVNTKAIKRDGYIGCFIDQHPNRDLKKMFTVNNLTPVSCQSVCKEKGHAYAGVQYGYLCHCGDEYGKYGEAGEHECNSACLGDDGKRCGGFWRNSVYTSEIPDDKETLEDDSTKRESRSHIDRVIPIPQTEQEETPVQQEITVYLKSEIPKTHENPITTNHKDEALTKRPSSATTNSKRTEIPKPNVNQGNRPDSVVHKPSKGIQSEKRTEVNSNVYLHPQQTGPTEFVPSNVVLRTLTTSTKKRKYTGFIKLKQNWDDGLQMKTNPKTLILAGNIETAFAEIFAKDPQFEKAEVLSLREAEIQDNPGTVHKVLVEFALMFKKDGKKKDEILRNIVEKNSRVGEMPVFADSLDIKEYDNEKNNSSNDAATAKEKRQDGVDAFLEEVFRQI